MLSRELERIIGAVKEVKMRQHEFLTLEHLLYSYTIDVMDRVCYMDAADVDRLRDNWSIFTDHMKQGQRNTK